MTPEPRFYTVEVSGFLPLGSSARTRVPGLSVMVIDDAYSREIATFRTEDNRSGTQNVRWRRARKAAQNLADTLNAEREAKELAA